MGNKWLQGGEKNVEAPSEHPDAPDGREHLCGERGRKKKKKKNEKRKKKKEKKEKDGIEEQNKRGKRT